MSSINYEKETVTKMIHIYCWKKHGSKRNELCSECEAVNQYAQKKLDKCPFGDNKTACAKCKIHCYNNEMRERIRVIMRFSGPRMLFYAPFDYLMHIFRDLRKTENELTRNKK
ncbi:MAG: nitrous oxide-stimulated promoter family protein [Paludibacteraceae bacterium]